MLCCGVDWHVSLCIVDLCVFLSHNMLCCALLLFVLVFVLCCVVVFEFSCCVVLSCFCGVAC